MGPDGAGLSCPGSSVVANKNPSREGNFFADSPDDLLDYRDKTPEGL
jgi:hypothetical protein